MKTVAVHELGWTPVRATRWLQPTSAEVGTHGVVGDRVWSAITPDGECLRAAMHPGQFPVEVNPEDLPSPGPATSTVRYWGRTFPASIHDGVVADRMSAALRTAVRLAHTPQRPGFIWGAPLSVLCLSDMDGLPGPLSRYRANIVLDDRESPLPLSVGSRLEIGAITVLVAEPIDRCVVIELDPRTGERDADTLSRLGRKPQLGWGCRVIRPGIVRVGDGGNPEPAA